jgi:molecular chaperone DnaK (HSP70)
VSAADDVEGKIFVVDLGGGTFDVSALDISSQRFSTLAIGGERRLGGDDFDECLVRYFLKYIESDLSIDLSSLERSGLGYDEYYTMMSRIRKGAVELKEELSESEEVTVEIPRLFTYGADKRHYDFSMEMDRETFNSICAPLFERIIQVIDKTVKNSAMFKKEELKKIFLVGGSCYIPKVQEDVERYFGLSANSEQDRATQVAMGAGKIADAWDGFTPEKNRVDPFGDKLQDIISHAMGIGALDGDRKHVFSQLLAEGTPYPCVRQEMYYTVYDNQDSVTIEVYEKTDSDSPDYIEENHKNFDLYGSFVLEGIDKAPAGQTEICVTFEYDQSRTLHVTAEDPKNHVAKQVELHKGQIVKESRRVKPTDFFVLLDVSGSMDGKRMEEAQNACRKLIMETLDLDVHRLGLITFGSQAKLLCSLTQDKRGLLKAVEEAGVSLMGSTNMSEAIRMGRNELRQYYSSSRSNSGLFAELLSTLYGRERDNSRNKAMILITDGDPDNSRTTLQEAAAARNSQISIATIGVYGAVEEFLRKVSDDSNLCFMVNNIEKLSDTFGQAVANLLRK